MGDKGVKSTICMKFVLRYICPNFFSVLQDRGEEAGAVGLVGAKVVLARRLLTQVLLNTLYPKL